MAYFQGSVPEAVAASRAGLKPLLVLLAGRDAAGDAAERALLGASDAEHLAGSVLLRLDDNLADGANAAYADARAFRAFCPTDALPTVALVSPSGATLALVKGAERCADAQALHAALAAGFEQVKQQQKAVLAARAFAALAQQVQQQQQGTSAAAPGTASATPSTAAPAAPAAAEQPAAMPMQPPAAAAAPAAVQSAAGRAEDEQSERVRADELPQLEGPEEEVEEMEEDAAASPAAAAAPAAAAPSVQEPQPAGESLPPVAGAGSAAGAAPVPAAMEVEQPPTATGDEAAASEQEPADVPMAAAPSPPAAEPTVPAAPAAKEPLSQQQQQHTPAPAPEPPAPVGPRPCSLHLRLPGGGSLTASFPSFTPLGEVFAAVDAQLAEDAGRAAPAPYVLVVPHPRRQLGPAEAGHSLAELGLESRVALLVEADAKGHRPGAAASGAAAGAASAAPSAAADSKPARQEVVLQVRLTNGDILRNNWDAETTTLCQVLDWVDERRTDGGRPYKVRSAYPERTYYSNDLSSTLAALRLVGRASLQLDPLPPRPTVAAAPSAPAAAAPAAAAKTEPALFTLQFSQLDGGSLRGEFAPDATLQEVYHFVDAHRTDGGGAYSLVQPYPRRRFAAGGDPGAEEQLGQTLGALGLCDRSRLIMEPRQGGGAAGGGGRSGGWGLGGLLSSAASYLNPWAYLGRPQYEPNAELGEALRQQGAAAQAGGATEPGAPAGPQNGTRKRGFRQTHGAEGGSGSGSGGASNIHTLGGGERERDWREGRRDDDRNAYWNGNSTEFGGGDDSKDGSK